MMDKKHYILIEGGIGLGKTTLAKALGKKLGARVMFEPAEGVNPYLDDYYSNPAAYAFKIQIFLLWRRFRAHTLAQALVMQGECSVISDRSYYGDRAFACVQRDQGFFDERDFDTYTELHRDMGRSLVLPSCVILLDGDADLAFGRISKRGRGCEVGMSKEYWQAVQDATIKEACAVGAHVPLFIRLDARCDVDSLVEQICCRLDIHQFEQCTYRSV